MPVGPYSSRTRFGLLAGALPALGGLVGYVLLPAVTGTYAGGLSFAGLVFDELFARPPTFHLLALVVPGFLATLAVLAHGRRAPDGDDPADAPALVVAVPAATAVVTGIAVLVAVGVTDGLVWFVLGVSYGWIVVVVVAAGVALAVGVGVGCGYLTDRAVRAVW